MSALRRFLLTGLVLAAFIGVARFFALRAGLFLDDHAHFASLRKGNWSFQSAVDAAELGIVGQVMDLWGNTGSGLRFFRPVSFWVMRAEYTLLGWPVDGGVGMHLFSLAWHWLAAMLVVTLACRLLGNWTWALLAGIWFAVHPGNTVTVHWIACQTELMVTVCALSAVLCYARWSGWWPIGSASPDAAQTTGAWLFLAATLLFFSLGLGCRENAVIVPVMAFLGDFYLRPGRLRRRGRWGAYALFVVTVAGYLVIRDQALGGFPLPGPPYLHRPGHPDFLAFVATKFLYYMLGLFLYVPVLPIGGLAYLREHPWLFYPPAALCIAVLAAVLVALRRHRGVWMATFWTLAGIGIMLPIFASPHHLYLPMVGASVMLAAGLAWLRGPRASTAGQAAESAGAEIVRSPGAGFPRLAGVLVTLLLVLLPLGALSNGWIYATATGIEDEVIREIRTYDRPLREGDHLFFINIPMLAYYAKPALENQLGMRLYGHALTFSPSLWSMGRPCTVEQLDDHTFTVTLDGYDFLAGLAGESVLYAMERTEPFRTGEVIHSELYDVEVLDAVDGGIASLKFTFHRPLTDASYHFYLGSRVQFAYPLPFAPPEQSATHRLADQSPRPATPPRP